MGRELTTANKYPYHTSIEPVYTRTAENELFGWCVHHFGRYDENWTTHYDSLSHKINFKFKKSEDCVLFSLRWQ